MSFARTTISITGGCVGVFPGFCAVSLVLLGRQAAAIDDDRTKNPGKNENHQGRAEPRARSEDIATFPSLNSIHARRRDRFVSRQAPDRD